MLCVLCKKEKKDIYTKEFPDINILFFEDIKKMREKIKEKGCYGIILDLRTIFKVNNHIKENFLRESIKIPKIYSNIDNNNNTNFIGIDNISNIDEFKKEINNKKINYLRYKTRYNLNRSLMLTHNNKIIKSFTINISTTGCFILYCEKDIKVGDIIYIEFNEMNKKRYKAEVRWIEEWGTKSIPGFGVYLLEDVLDIKLFR